MEELTLTDTLELLNMYILHVRALKNFYSTKKVKCRYPNFPEDISENIVKFLIEDTEGIKCKRLKTKGDLITSENKHLEVKCFTSLGPSSFGPNEAWDVIYFLDAQDFLNGNFILHKVNLSNSSSTFQSIPLNSRQTYGDQCKQKRRPRISFENLQRHIRGHTTTIFNGNVPEHLSRLCIEKNLQELTINNSAI